MLGRYVQLLHAIDLFRPQSIVEIGTWSGENAIRMILRAQKYHEKVDYIGYDLFEEATPATDSAELNIKRHFHVDEVEGRIKAACPDSEIHLIKGNTRKTLTRVSADFCFIDGGHSVETISSDHARCSGSSVIVHDDYYVPDADGAMPDIGLYGCNRLMGDLAHKGGFILPMADPVKGGGMVQMVMLSGGGK